MVQAASVPPFQNVAPRASQSQATSGPFFIFATTAVAPASVFQKAATPSSAAASLPSIAPAPVLASHKAAMAQAEDSRLFEAHMNLLAGSGSEDLHEISGTPLFTKKVLDHLENLFSQYGFLAGISSILDSNAPMNVSTTGSSGLADPRLFFNISAPSSAFICGS
jgi:hypothetical protein